MALKPYIKFGQESKDGTVFTLEDVTGLSSDGIMTGYGGTNPESTDIVSSMIKISVLTLDKEILFEFDNTTDPTAIQVADQEDSISVPFNSADLEVGSGADKLPIGLYKATYYVYFTPSSYGTLTANEGSKTVTRSEGDFTVDFKDTNVILLGEEPYIINKSKNFTALSIELLHPLQEDGVTSFLVGYSHQTTFAIYNSLNESFVQAIARFPSRQCGCDESQIKNLMQAMIHKTSIDIDIANGNYEQANEHIKAMACAINRRDLIY